MTTKTLSKADEIQILRDFVAGLPQPSYLHIVLEPFVEEFANDVYCDLVPPIHESWQARIDARNEAVEEQKRVEEIRKEGRELQREIQLLENAQEGIKKQIRELRDRLSYLA